MSGTNGSVAAAAGTDAEYEILCDSNGAFIRRYSLGPSGALTTTDTTLDGVTAYVPVGTVTRCGNAPANPQIDSTIQRQTGAGTVTIAAGARSVTLNVYTGSPTVALSGAAAVTVPAGSSLTWSVDRGGKAGETLQDSFVFTGVAGTDFIVLSTREL